MPLTWKELNTAHIFDLDRYLLFGGLPRVYLSKNPTSELSDYVDTYLDQEIKAEAITRNILGFEKFLQKIAFASGETIVLQNIANDVQVSAPTIRQYIEVLEDTLLAHFLVPWQSPKRKAIQSSKLYFFDLGIKWFLSGVETIPQRSNLFGTAFEQFIIAETRAYHSYSRSREHLCFWRTTHQDEVDLIIGKKRAIEIKASEKTSLRDASGLMKIKDEGFEGKLTVVSRDPINRLGHGIEFLHWETFFKELWSGN